MRNLGTLPGGNSSKAFGISDTGLVVGGSASPFGNRAVLWSRGSIQNLGTLPGDMTSEAFAISNNGSVVGYSRGLGGVRAFLWTSSKGMQSLSALPGATVTRALGLNEQGDVVGSSGSGLGDTGSGLRARAVLWSSGKAPQDLNTLVPVPTGVVLLEAVGINGRGQILVLGGDEKNAHGFHEGSSRVFLLTPN